MSAEPMENGPFWHARKRPVSAQRALSRIESGFTVFIEGGVGHPDSLMPAFMERCREVGNIKIVTSLFGGLPPYCAEGAEGIAKVISFRGSQESAAAIAQGTVDVAPANLSAIPRLLSGPLLPDAALIQVTPPDPNGLCSLGPWVLYNRSALKAAGVVIAEINPELPWTCGDSTVHVSDIDFLVEGSHPIPSTAPAAPSDAEIALATNVVGLVPDHAVVQVGMGSVATAILEKLAERSHIKIHAGLLSDGVIALARSESLAMVSSPIIAGAFYGSEALYEFIDRNPRIAMKPVEYTHNSEVIGRYRSFVSINSALEVDLGGQANAEIVKGLPISGAGGQGDFIHGAALSPGGKSVVALTSTTRDGRRSKIVVKIADPGIVTTPRTDIDFVVSEFGVAELRGKGLRERAEALLSIADPQFAQVLREEVGM